MTEPIILEVQDLRTYLHTDRGIVRAVDGISLTVRAEETVALVGESGCGKTMTALSIMGLLPATGRVVSGRIYFEGRNLLETDLEELRTLRGKRLAMVYQDPMTFLNPIMRVGRQVAEVLMVHENMLEKDARQRVLEVFGLLGIPSPAKVFESYPHQLSGGMRQRIIIAMAIIGHPALLVADEPTTALDVSIQAQIMELLRETRRTLKNSVLLISHDLGLVAENCDRAYVMYAGHIVEHGDIETIYRNPKHPYTEGLLKANLSPERTIDRFETIEGEVANLVSPPSGCPFHPRCKRRKDVCGREFPPGIDLLRDHMVWCWLLA